MTREEAVIKLTNIMHDDHYSRHPSILEAFRMAVDALKGGGDCISRQEALDAIEAYFDGLPIVVHHDMIAMIRRLPSAQPEIVRCEDCKHYKEWESEFTPNAVVTQCMADNFPIRKAIPDGWFCAGAERRTDED